MEISLKENNRIIDSLNYRTESEIAMETAKREKALRRSCGITQAEMASKSGVSLGSIRRFESCGEISYVSLLKLAWVLDCTTQFDSLFAEESEKKRDKEYTSIDQALKEWNR